MTKPKIWQECSPRSIYLLFVATSSVPISHEALTTIMALHLSKDITSRQTLGMEYVIGVLGRAGNKVHLRSISLGI